jgi:undecaprenyl-diphosphatase
MKKNAFLLSGALCFILFITFLIIEKTIGDRPITGFLGNINGLVDYKYNKTIDVISDLLLYASFAFVLFAVIIGVMQLVKNKNLFKVDPLILIYGIFIVLSIIIWILLDKVIKVSYRPLNDENSYPSTHVFLFTYFTLTGIVILFKYIKKDILKKILFLIALILAVVIMPLFRVLAGMHYITDVFGGILLGLSFFFLTIGFTINNEKNNEVEHDN